jgi:ABC-type antimicrobial peptide transport system permease subunit
MAGAALGLIGAFVVAHAIAGLLVGVQPNDVLTFGAAAGVLTVVALAGCFLPARRAIYVDPNITLR